MEDITFEEAFRRLEEIVGRLEMGELSLQESLKLYEEGIKYSRICLKILSDAEKRIEVVNISDDGSFSISEIEPEKFLENE